MRLVDLVGIVQVGSGGEASVVVLREHEAPHRLLPILIGGAEAASIALAATGQTLPRPLTHDLMADLIDQLDVRIDDVEVTEVRDGAILAAIDLSSPQGRRRLDTRPSDGIALAVRFHAPLWVSEEVLDAAGTPSDEDGDLDEAAIEAQLDEFRSFLADVEPEDFDPTGDIGGVGGG
jgi:bifunctional DNase/RNase